jgi:molybdopterin synthase sulfur carrier subunit
VSIEILYFASLRERLGIERESLELPPGVGDLGALLDLLGGRGGIWAEIFAGDERVLMAINQEMAQADDTVRDGDEVGLFPPVTGG